MSFSLENLIVVIIAVLPGFVSAAIRATLKPGQSPSAGEWVAGSIVASLFLNALAFVLFIGLFRSIDLGKPLSQLKPQFSALAGWTTLYYLACLYGLALIWGFVSGLSGDRFELRVWAYRLRLTPISPETSVFVDVLRQLIGGKDNRALGDDPKRQVAWLQIHRDGKLIQGRIRKSSIRFGVNDPIEVYLFPGYVFAGGAIIQRADGSHDTSQKRGLYLRLRPEDIADILVAPASWSPVGTAAPPPAAPIVAPQRWYTRLANALSCRSTSAAPALLPPVGEPPAKT
jgi:hypothetical protein